MSTLLRTTLTANAAFSTACALVLTLAAWRLDGVLGVSPWLLLVLGVALAGFGVFVAITSARRWMPGAWAVLAADVTWVVTAAVVVVGFNELLTTAGVWALVAVTIVVLDFAVAEALGIRRAAEVRP